MKTTKTSKKVHEMILDMLASGATAHVQQETYTDLLWSGLIRSSVLSRGLLVTLTPAHLV